MQDQLDIVCDVSQRLDRAGISYMLTGSMAMNYYGQPRMTRDIDVVVALAPSDADKIIDLFQGSAQKSNKGLRFFACRLLHSHRHTKRIHARH